MPDSTAPRKFRRVLLKLSGEALRQPGSTDNISPPIVEDMAAQIKAAHQTGSRSPWSSAVAISGAV
jgi:uridylate kinase